MPEILISTQQQQQLQEQGKTYTSALEEYKKFEIQTQEHYDFACEQLRLVAAQRKEFDKQEKQATQPINSALSTIRGWFKAVDSPLQAIETVLRQKVSAYNAAKQAENQARMNQAAAAFQQGNGSVGLQLINQVQAQPVVKAAGVSTTKRIQFRYTDPKLVPREYCAPVDALIRAQLKITGLQTKIPGIEVYEELGVSVRSK